MSDIRLSRLVGAGFLATLVMTLVMYVAPILGLPRLDTAQLLGHAVTLNASAPFSGTWWIGMGIHFILGSVVFPLIYGALVHPNLSGAQWFRGVVFGASLWLLQQSVVLPLLGLGVFSTLTSMPGLTVLLSLASHFLYGVTLGAAANERVRKVQVIDYPEVYRRAA